MGLIMATHYMGEYDGGFKFGRWIFRIRFLYEIHVHVADIYIKNQKKEEKCF